MKKRSVLAFGLLTACGGILVAACGSEDGTPQPPQTSAGASGAPPTTSGGGGSEAVTAGATSAGATTVAGAESAGTGGTGGTGPTCDIPSLEVFQRSDTDQSWDDQDFSDVVLTTGCPTTVDVTWPHEPEAWLPDKVDANFEPARFTLDSYYSNDLTGKQINVDLELTKDMRGPKATAGGYVAYLVSVSSYERIVVVEPPPTAGTGGDSGTGGSGGSSGEGAAGSGGASGSDSGNGGASGLGGGATETSGSGGETAGAGGTAPTTVTETGYQEAIAEGRVTFTRVGEKATLSFALPNKTDAIDSYDPARVIKINIRIESLYNPPTPAEGTAGAGGMGGLGGEGVALGGTAGLGGDAGLGGSSGSGGSAGAEAVSGSGGVSGDTGTGGTAGAAGPAPVTGPYDYLTSQFTITNFTVTDAL